MGILDQLHARFRVDARAPPATPAELQELRRFATRRVPDEYLELAQEATEVEILVDGTGYIRIWGPAGCVEMNEAYQIQNELPGSLAIGDDEGGQALIYMLGAQGDGLYLVGFGALDVDEAAFIAPSLRVFLCDGQGPQIGT